MKNVFALFLCFTLLFVAFNPISFSRGFEFPTFFEINSTEGYRITEIEDLKESREFKST